MWVNLNEFKTIFHNGIGGRVNCRVMDYVILYLRQLYMIEINNLPIDLELPYLYYLDMLFYIIFHVGGRE
jgi:hypothetical protein